MRLTEAEIKTWTAELYDLKLVRMPIIGRPLVFNVI